MSRISIIIPAYNEQTNIEPMIQTLNQHLAPLTEKHSFDYIFVDDGSRDNTPIVLREMSTRFPNVFYIQLSRNFGHQGALLAGLTLAKGDAMLSMDCDLQHPSQLIPQMIQAWEDGHAIVYTLREEDKRLPWHKRLLSKWFYKLVNIISDVKIQSGASDFRLMDRRVVDEILAFNDHDIFLRGAVAWIGFPSTSIKFKPQERWSGQSKFTFGKMTALALKGITSQSVKPLYYAIAMGLFFGVLSLLYLPYVIISWVNDSANAGWSSIVLSIAFFGSMQLIFMGIIGLYIAKIFRQVKNRPAFVTLDSNVA